MAQHIVSASGAGDSVQHSAVVHCLAVVRQAATSAPAGLAGRFTSNVVKLAREPALRQRLRELRGELEAVRRSAAAFEEATVQSRAALSLGAERLAHQVAAIERRLERA